MAGTPSAFIQEMLEARDELAFPIGFRKHNKYANTAIATGDFMLLRTHSVASYQISLYYKTYNEVQLEQCMLSFLSSCLIVNL